MSWRPGPNGTITHPKRGSSPLVPDGYAVRSGNPFVAELVLPLCQFRERIAIARVCCGGNSTVLYCHYYKRLILSQECIECPFQS